MMLEREEFEGQARLEELLASLQFVLASADGMQMEIVAIHVLMAIEALEKVLKRQG